MLAEHLGGHLNKTHLDHGALDWLVKEFHIKSFLDIGCGPGGMVELAEKSGLNALGIDGDHTLERYNPQRFIIHDYTKGIVELDRKFDLAWSVEFLEHVEEQYMPNYMHSFQYAKHAVVTYAPPGTNGHHHVNLQEEDYWLDKFAQYGFMINQDATRTLRQVSTMNVPKKIRKAFIYNRGLFLTNEN